MKFLVLGGGAQGSACAFDLLRREDRDDAHDRLLVGRHCVSAGGWRHSPGGAYVLGVHASLRLRLGDAE